MTEVLHANIFFVITSVAVVVFTLLLCFAVYQIIKILKSIRRIVDRIDEGSEMIAGDMDNLRTYVMEGSLVSQLIGFFMGNKGAARRKRKSQDDE
jgi:5-bromo-4-chloroindolyl phosphate hydrolysis protein